MVTVEHPSINPEAQRQTERHWLAVLGGNRPPAEVRPVVRESWERALRARIPTHLAHAPVVWDEGTLEAGCQRTDWLSLAERTVSAHEGAYAEGGHILALFDATGRMLRADGDPRALDGLHKINFRPGALWAEHAVGTNGPGTALATGRPVHIVGAEHFCGAWQPWHCAAVPFRDPLTREISGVVNLSGFRDAAHPHTLTLAIAMAVALEQMLLARDAERRVLVLRRFGDFASRWPNDAVVAVDRSGVVIGASQRAPAALHPLAPPTERLRASLAEVVQASTAEGPREVWIHGGGEAYSVVAHPVFDGAVPVGACMVVHLPAVGQRVATASPLGARSGRANGTTRYSLYDLVGESERLREAHRIAIAAAANTLPVLILGESGTGKEMFAQGIHAASRRASLPFVAVNCAAIPSELLESELFGYVGGAFSGARREGSAGKFEAADGGTLFLDELTELPLSAQAALLRVLQEGEVTRVGATQARPVDVRVIAATNCDVIEKLASGGLRSDLYYRLGVLTMELPPLRERRGDIARLARHFLQAAEAELDRPGYTFAPAVLDVFEAYAWPGNVRELNNLVRRLVALAPSDEITLSDLPSTMRPIVEEYRGELREGAAEPEGETAAVRQRIAWAVRHGGTMREAAALLGITRSTLYRQMQRYGLHPERILRGDS